MSQAAAPIGGRDPNGLLEATVERPQQVSRILIDKSRILIHCAIILFFGADDALRNLRTQNAVFFVGSVSKPLKERFHILKPGQKIAITK